MPSVIAWWIFSTTAALPSGSPETSVSSHSGLARSKSCSAIRRAVVSAGRRVPSSTGARCHRRWYDRSKLGSVSHRGGVGDHELPETRWRNFGTARVIRSIRSIANSRSGSRSRTSSAMITERRTGSPSMPYITASNAASRGCLSMAIYSAGGPPASTATC